MEIWKTNDVVWEHSSFGRGFHAFMLSSLDQD